METKLFIAYLVLCFYYSACRTHYLMTVKEDEEFNSLYGEIVNYIGRVNANLIIISLQLFLSPIMAPISMSKRAFGLVFPSKKDKK